MNQILQKIAFSLLAIFLTCCNSKSSEDEKLGSYLDPSVQYVALEELILHKSKYHGLIVQTTGYLSERFEERALYKEQTNPGNRDPENAIWIYFSADAKRKLNFDSLTAKNILIKGVVDTTKRGHVSAYPCSLFNADVIISNAK